MSTLCVRTDGHRVQHKILTARTFVYAPSEPHDVADAELQLKMIQPLCIVPPRRQVARVNACNNGRRRRRTQRKLSAAEHVERRRAVVHCVSLYDAPAPMYSE